MTATGTNNEALNNQQENDAFSGEDENEEQGNGKLFFNYIHFQLSVNY